MQFTRFFSWWWILAALALVTGLPERGVADEPEPAPMPDATDEPGAPSTPDELAKLDERYQKEYAAGTYKEAESTARKIVELAETKFTGQPAELAGRVRNVGNVLFFQEKYKDAEPFYKRAIGLFEKAGGSNDAELAIALNNLGVTYYRLKRYDDAEPLLKRVRNAGAIGGPQPLRIGGRNAGPAPVFGHRIDLGGRGL